MKQTIVIKEYGTMAGAQRYCKSIESQVTARWNGRVVLGCNQIDSCCVQVELIGEFGSDIYIVF